MITLRLKRLWLGINILFNGIVITGSIIVFILFFTLNNLSDNKTTGMKVFFVVFIFGILWSFINGTYWQIRTNKISKTDKVFGTNFTIGQEVMTIRQLKKDEETKIIVENEWEGCVYFFKKTRSQIVTINLSGVFVSLVFALILNFV